MDQLPPDADLHLIPAIPHPDPTYIPNLIGKGDLEDATIAICSVLIVLQVILIGIRFFTKVHAKMQLAFNDWCALTTAIVAFGLCFCQIHNRAMGRHIWDISIGLALDETNGKIYFASFVMIGPAIILGKITMLSLYLRIFGDMPKVRWILYIATFISLSQIFWTPLNAIKCAKPKGQHWGSSNPACSDTYLYGIYQGLISLAIDLFILILPLPIIWHLNLEKSKKYGVLVIFATGTLAIIADAIAIKFRVDLHSARDPSWAGYLITLMGIIETSVSVICSSMPTLAKFSRHYLLEWSYVVKIRSYLDSRLNPSIAPSNIPKEYQEYKEARRKRPDPYSINMGTDSSGTELGNLTYIEIKDRQISSECPK